MAKCTYCGREGNSKTKFVGGYEILECCTDCEWEIENDQREPEEDYIDGVTEPLDA